MDVSFVGVVFLDFIFVLYVKGTGVSTFLNDFLNFSFGISIIVGAP